jgi:hypothetical protein
VERFHLDRTLFSAIILLGLGILGRKAVFGFTRSRLFLFQGEPSTRPRYLSGKAEPLPRPTLGSVAPVSGPAWLPDARKGRQSVIPRCCPSFAGR